MKTYAFVIKGNIRIKGKNKKPINPDKLRKRFLRLTATERGKIIIHQLRAMSKSDDEINEFLAAK